MRRLVVGVLTLLAVGAASGPARAAPPGAEDAFLRGYVAAVLERELGVRARSLVVHQGVVRLDAADLAGTDRARVVAALEAVRGVTRVEVREAGRAPAAPDAVTGPAAGGPRRPPDYQVGLMPGGELFRPLIADLRWPHFSAAYHGDLDDPEFGNLAAVSFGETFTLYRGRAGEGWWEVGVQAGVFALFDLDADSSDLINADYLVAGVLGYRWRALSALGRLFHQSSHLGDEFLLRQTRVDRINLSYEGLDARLSWEAFGDALRVYAGGGRLLRRDPPELQPWFAQYGVEVRSPWPDPAAGWRPVAAVDVQHREQNAWAGDLSVRAGVQFDGVLVTRNLQLLLEYFRGHSPSGQFFRREIDYLGVGAHFHF